MEKLPLLMHRHGYDEPTWFTFSYSPVRDDSGEVAGMYCACVEVTEQVLAERYRDEENKRLVTLFEQAPGIIAVLRGPEHVFEITNKSYMQLIGRTRPDRQDSARSLARSRRAGLLRAARPGLHQRRAIRRPCRAAATWRASPARRSNGVISTLSTSRSATRPARWSGIFVEGSDVTVRKQVEDELRAANRQKDQFLAMLAHELRNPLAPITTAAQLLKLRPRSTPRACATPARSSRARPST